MCLFLCLLNFLFILSFYNLPSGLRDSLSLKLFDFLSLCDECPPCPPSTDPQCKTTAKADIILLVDGSWSIGRLNFKTIRSFIGRMVGVFDIGPDKVQIGEGLVLWRIFFFKVQIYGYDNAFGRQM